MIGSRTWTFLQPLPSTSVRSSLCLALAGVLFVTAALPAQTLDDSLPPGENYSVAQFRLWMPQGMRTIREVLVLVPGSNGDGRAMAQDTWQSFATRHDAAIVACRFTDKRHDQGFIENYVNVSQGSGQALLDAISRFAERTRHAEMASAPLLLWGMSAGGQFDYEFAAWKPDRVIAFVVNKGGIYYTGTHTARDAADSGAAVHRRQGSRAARRNDHRALRREPARRRAVGARERTGSDTHRRPLQGHVDRVLRRRASTAARPGVRRAQSARRAAGLDRRPA